jgi:hypothetical protein
VRTSASATLARTACGAAALALLAAGILVRAWDVVPAPLDFWADEAWWATLLQTGEYAQHAFRPAGYMWLCRALLESGSPELMLRLPSLIAGCVALVCLYCCAELSTRTRAGALFVVLLAALHPKLVVFSKEFKPYSVEVLVFSGLTLWTLWCVRRGRGMPGLITASLAALPFCYPVVFLYPGIAIALYGERLAFLRRLSGRQWFYAALVIVSALALAHFYVYERSGVGAYRVLWGEKYDVFPLDTGLLGGAAWYAEKTWSLLTLPGGLDSMPRAALSLFATGYAGGIAVLATARRWRELALFAVPLIAVLAANLLGYWPYGAFRANLFLIPGMLLVTAQSVDWLAARARIGWVAYALVAAILAAALAGGVDAYRGKRSTHWAAAPQLTEVLEEIVRRNQLATGPGPGVILADWHSWRPILYYLPRFPRLADRVGLVRGPVADAAALESQLDAMIARAPGERGASRIWLVVTNLRAHAAVLESEAVASHAVHRREFKTGDRGYHPVLIELDIAASR